MDPTTKHIPTPDDRDAERMNKAKRLAIAAAVAPILRCAAEGETSGRKVGRVDGDGNVVGYTTLAEVQRAILKRHHIEIDVQPGVKPEEVPCGKCGLPVSVPKHGLPARQCERCRTGGQTHCAGYDGVECDKPPSPEAFVQKNIRARHGEQWRCKACHHKHQTRHLKPLACAGYDGHECQHVSGPNAARVVKAHRLTAWRCRGCSAKYRVQQRLVGKQSVCAGYDGHECIAPVPSHAFGRRNIESRGGRPWRCKACSTLEPSYRAKRTALARKQLSDPERRAANAKLMQTWRESPRWRPQQSEKMRRLHADPVIQAKRVESVRKAHRKQAGPKGSEDE